MYDVAIIGAGIAGCSLVYELGKYQIRAVLIEKKDGTSVGTTKVNSAIIHGGYDPLPGSKMAKYNVAGNAYIKELYGGLGIPYKQIGVLIIALSEAGERTFEELRNRGIQSDVKDMGIWDKRRLHREEPHASQEARAVPYPPNVGIVSPQELTLVLAEVAIENSIEVKLSTEVKNVEKTGTEYSVETNRGAINAVCVCNAAGMLAGKVSKIANDATFKIESNKGEYYLSDESQGNLISHIVFQCPNKNGKGVLVASTVHGNPIIGPDSRPASREDVSITAEDLSYVRSTALKSISDINFRESVRNFAGVRARTKEDDFFVYENPENRPFYNIAGMASPGLLSAPVVVLDVIKMMRESGLPLTKKEACVDTRSAVRFRGMNHEERTMLIEEHSEYGKTIYRCEAVTEREITDTVRRPIPAVSIDAVRHCYNAGMGRCQDGFCGPHVQKVITRELKKDLKDVSLDREGMILITGETKVTEGEQE